MKLNIQIEQLLVQRNGYNELQIELLRNLEMYNIKRNHDIKETNGVLQCKY